MKPASQNEAPSTLDQLAPLSSSLYGVPELLRDQKRKLLSLDLAGGYGWGPMFNQFLGGGLSPGDLVGVGAASAGAGKTAFLMQLADGLALRCSRVLSDEEQGPLTPVLLLSELSPAALARRQLAWAVEVPGYLPSVSIFRAGFGNPDAAPLYEEAKRLLRTHAEAKEKGGSPGRVFQIRQWQRQVSPSRFSETARTTAKRTGASFSVALVEQIRHLVNEWRVLLQESFGREVWPVVVLDPVQRWQEAGRNELESLNELARALDDAADQDGFLVFFSSDTNKTSAKGELEGDPLEVGAGLFRGSYTLLHCADVALYLARPEGDPKDPVRTVPVRLFKNRHGQSFGEAVFRWRPRTGRFVPLSELEAAKLQNEKQDTLAATKSARSKNGKAKRTEDEL